MLQYLGASQILAAATVVLGIGAVITAVFAIKAFGKQATEVTALEQQGMDQQRLINQQADMLKVQADQLEVQQQGLEEQRAINVRQTDVLELQVKELRASLEQREREAGQRRHAQAAAVFIWEDRHDRDPRISQVQTAVTGVAPGPVIVAHVKNTSRQPIYDVSLSWHRGSMPWQQPDPLPTLMPGDEKDSTRALPSDLPSNVDPAVFGAVVFFRDAAGICWRVRPDGQFDEIPPEHLPPHTW
jgi:hypothetical protein